MAEHAVSVSPPMGAEPNHGTRHPGFWKLSSPAVPLIIFVVLTGAIAVVGVMVFEQYRHNMQQAVQKDLFSITDAKVKQFLAWRDERRGDASALINDDSFRAEFEHWVKEGMANDARRKRLLQRLVALRDAYGYEDILLYDKTMALALRTNPDALPATSFGMILVGQVLRDGGVEHSDLHYLRQDGREHVRLGTLAPLRPAGADAGPPSGVALLRSDPTKDLFPLIQTWPMPTQSGETFLAKREADSIIYLTELRHFKASGMAARFAVSDEKLLAAQTARGKEGLLEGVDYRGVAVIGAARLIPGTSWLVVSKIDKEEIYAPIRRTGWIGGIVTLLFVLGAGVAMAIWWRNQRNALLARAYQARLMHESTQRRLDNVSKYANDIILLTDEHLRIFEANDRALEAYGYSWAELQGMHASALHDPARLDSFEGEVHSGNIEGSVYETVHRRRDGTSFPVEVSARLIELDGRHFHQAIIRDISERKQAEAAIRAGEAQLRATVDRLNEAQRIAHLGNWTLDLVSGTLIWSDEIFRLFEIDPNRFGATYEAFLDAIHPEDRDALNRAYTASLANRAPYEATHRLLMADGRIKWVHERCDSKFDAAGQPIRSMGTVQDITTQKLAEESLIESRQQLRSLSAHQEGLLEQERKHIAREVHDELGQLLTALKMDISLLRLRLDQDPVLVEKLEGMRTLAENTITVVRHVASNLRPSALDLGLLPAIEWLSKDFNQRWGIPCSIDLSGDEMALDDATATTVFRVVQESLTNIARHAQASEVTISLHYGSRLLLQVKDNGCGFDPTVVRKLLGLGLFGMRERILSIGGTLRIDSESGIGTTLAIELPLSKGDSI